MKKSYLFLLVIIGVVYLSTMFQLGLWKKALYGGDSNGYYLHVVSFFINDDVGDYDKTIKSLQAVAPNAADPRDDKFGIRLTSKGKYYIKYTLGVPLMETPFFLLGHAYAKNSDQYEANGWTRPYLLAVSLSTIFYVLIAFYLLALVLSNFYEEKIVLLTLITIAFATNLLFQSTYVTMSHGFLFFQHSLLIYFCFRFYKKPKLKWAILIGMAIALISITRVPELISGLVFLLWGVQTWKNLKERFLFFIKNYKYTLGLVAGFFFVFSLQMTYWYEVSGQLIFDPYKGEGFDFLHPNIFKGWFDYANGWLIYTPVMAFSLLGWFVITKYSRALRWPIFTFVFLHIWIHYSWHAWTYYPGFGSRPMVETYALLSFSLAACFSFLMEKKWWKWIPFTAFVFFTGLNFFQTWQMRKGLIWTERGNAAFYWETFGKTSLTRNALIAFESREAQPDTSRLQFIENLSLETFEDTTDLRVTNKNVFAGNYAMTTTEEFIYSKEDFDLSQVKAGDYIRVGVYVYMQFEERNKNKDDCDVITIQFLNEKNKAKKTRGIHMAPFIGNKTNSIWSAGESGIWEEAYFYCKVPYWFDKGWHIKVAIWNPHKVKLYYDNLSVNLYR